MGHPKLKKKTYSKPTHPWQKERLEEEKALLNEFGLKNKQEVWKVASLLRKYAKQAKNLIALTTPQAEIEKAQLTKKLSSLGLIEETAKIEDVLTITLRDILGRRLQTLIHKNNLAKSIRQARQFISHEHVLVGDKKITSPSYLVSRQEEALISFASNSPLIDQDHAERVTEKEPIVKAPKEDKKTSKKTENKEKPKKEEKKKEKPKDKKEEKPKELSNESEKGLEKPKAFQKEPKEDSKSKDSKESNKEEKKDKK